MDDFLDCNIYIDIAVDVDLIVVCMRPLKVREYHEAVRLHGLTGDSDLFAVEKFVEIVNATIDFKGVLSPDNQESIIAEFIELNFNRYECWQCDWQGKVAELVDGVGCPRCGKVREKTEVKMAEVFDFLITQGHNHFDILEYLVPQFVKYQKAANDRLCGKDRKKKAGPLDFFRQMNIPIIYENKG